MTNIYDRLLHNPNQLVYYSLTEQMAELVRYQSCANDQYL